MWALRQASNSLRVQGLRLRNFQVGCVKLENFCGQLESKTSILDSPQVVGQTSLFHHAANVSSETSTGVQGLSSQAGTETGSSDDASSKFECAVSSDAIRDKSRLWFTNDEDMDYVAIPGRYEWEGDEDEYFYVDDIEKGCDAIPDRKEWEGNEDELISDPDYDVDDIEEHSPDALGLSDREANPSEKPVFRKRDSSSALFNAIVSNKSLSVEAVLSNWVEQGKDLGRLEVNSAMRNFRNRMMYERALQLSKWLEKNKKLDFVERDYALCLDLIAKVHCLQKAESFMDSIPKSFRGEIIYRTLLANCVIYGDVKMAEKVFNKMRDLEFKTTAFACNRLLILYKRMMDKKKIACILHLMKKEKVKYTLFTYKLLIEIKGQSNDISGMDNIVDTMKSEGVEPDLTTLAIIAKHYAYGGLDEKAEAILKEMEGGDLKENRLACRLLLPLYATLGKADEVGRVWKVCESSPRLEECVAAVEAWGRVKRIDKAEACFEKMGRTWEKLGSRHYSSLLKVYVNNDMVSKGNELVRKMAESGCQWKLSPPTWNTIVKQLLAGGAVEEAEALLDELVQLSKMNPTMSSYFSVMVKYATIGNVDKTEKMFFKMKQAGYAPSVELYYALLKAYFNGMRPPYGMRERMKADGIVPNTDMATMLELREVLISGFAPSLLHCFLCCNL